MEDSAKGFYVVLITVFVFILCITQFIVQFPLDQGFNFSQSSEDNANTYLTASNIDSNPTTELTNTNNVSNTGFEQWDVTQGFMGSNSIKQASQGGFISQVKMIFSSLTSMASTLFGENSPVMIVLGILLVATLGYITYVIIQFVRSGK